jgi:hypothetical protein
MRLYESSEKNLKRPKSRGRTIGLIRASECTITQTSRGSGGVIEEAV